MRCTHCAGPIYGRRADARYCSDACRVAAHRRRQAERATGPDLGATPVLVEVSTAPISVTGAARG